MESASLKILLADDDENDRLLFKEALVELKTNCIVDTVNNGIQSMDYLTKKMPLYLILFCPTLICPVKWVRIKKPSDFSILKQLLTKVVSTAPSI